MKEKILARRYAEAYINFSSRVRRIQEIADEIKMLKMLLGENPLFEDFLKSSNITYAQKCHFIDEILGRFFSEELRRFLKLLLKKNRIFAISAIANYIREKYAHADAVNTLLMSAYPLSDSEITAVKEKLERKLHKRLRFYLGIDGDLLGGLQVIIGNTVIDGSLKKRLLELKERLLALKV